ncbi:hypothetical protein [Pedobacter sp. MC2016-24]|uniref:hypothetical protein n=1 Tax=Pedobacter sp. MC2016-24 TaxID=2780090 RepID=UPI00187EA4B8|nr:hypothetical protein [Pedobacter sp. MC2016-24]MBE9603074.1 hypothetical protein [Pedobacter sp. MC2016-24]
MNHEENNQKTPESTEKSERSYQSGLDEWNNRLDENLEQEDTGNTEADEQARTYSNEHGSGDQSDETPIKRP